MRMRKRIYASYYSAANLGDDMFLHLVAKEFGNTHFSAASSRPSASLRRLDNLALHHDLVPRLVQRAFPRTRLLDRYRLETERVERGDGALIIGGSLFIETGSSDDLKRLAHLRDLPRPYVLAGCNVGPWKTDRYREGVQAVVAGADLALIRDTASVSAMGSLPNVVSSTDLLFCYPLPSVPRTDGHLVVSVVDPARKGSPSSSIAYLERMADLVADSLALGLRVTLMSFCRYEGDLAAARSIRHRLPADLARRVSIHSYSGDIANSLSVLLSASHVVGGRFHAIILGMAGGAKILPISYGSKLSAVLTDIGYPGAMLQLEDMDAWPARSELFDSFADFDVSAARSRAHGDFHLLECLLER